jgi:bacteriocin biosynthesis cyclodehydratase domain-containing protein
MAGEVIQLSVPLKLRRDAAFLQTEKGILFRSRKGSFSFQSRTIYRTFRQLLPHLSGQYTGDDVLRALRPEAQGPTGELLRKLLEYEVLQSVDREDAALLSSSLATAFSPQIEYLEHTADHPAARFLQFRKSRILLLGSGPTLASAGSALLRNGLARIGIESNHRAEITELAHLCREQAERGVECELDTGADHDPADFDLVLYCSARPNLQHLFALNQRAASGSFRLLPAVILNGFLVVGPLVQAGHRGCLQCAWLRWCEHLPAIQAARLWQAVATGVEPALEHAYTTNLQSRLLGNTAALEAFRLLVGGLNAESQNNLLVQTLSTFESALKPLLPHPGCTACSGSLREADERKHEIAEAPQEAMPVEECVQHWRRYTDTEFGYFSQFLDDDVEQLPLRISVLCYPSLRDGAQTEETAIGWDVDDVDLSKLRAMQRALEDKAFLASAPLLRTRLTYTAQPWQTLVPPQQIEGWLGIPCGEEREGLLEAWDLSSESPLLVPASAVHPVFNTGLFDRLDAGVGAGRDTEEATRRALFSLAEGIALASVATGTMHLHDWREEAPPATARANYLRSAYGQHRHEGERVLICEPCPGVFTAFVTAAGTDTFTIRTIGCGSGLSPSEAVEEACCERMARARLQAAGKDLATPPARRSSFPAGGLSYEVSPTPVQANAPSDSIDHVLARLAVNGYTLARLDLTPADVAFTRTMVLVKLLLVKR